MNWTRSSFLILLHTRLLFTRLVYQELFTLLFFNLLENYFILVFNISRLCDNLLRELLCALLLFLFRILLLLLLTIICWIIIDVHRVTAYWLFLLLNLKVKLILSILLKDKLLITKLSSFREKLLFILFNPFLLITWVLNLLSVVLLSRYSCTIFLTRVVVVIIIDNACRILSLIYLLLLLFN